MNEYNNQPANVFTDLQEGYSLIEGINAQINKQYQKIEDAKEELRQLKIDRNAYFTKFLKRAEEVRSLCEEYSHEMDQVSDEIRNNDEQLEKLRRKLTFEDNPVMIEEPTDDHRDLSTRRFPEAL